MIDAHVSSYRHPSAKTLFFEDLTCTTIRRGVTCLLGLSGSGKSTLINILLGIAPGHVDATIWYRFGDRTLSAEEACTAGMTALLTQHPTLVPWLSVERNLRLPHALNRRLPTLSGKHIAQTLSLINLDVSLNPQLPHMLSDGMKQRVGFARVLLYRPTFLFLDEVFSALDTVNADDLESAIRAYVDESGATCFLVTHDIARGLRLADTALYLNRSQKLESLPSGTRHQDVVRMMREDLGFAPKETTISQRST